MRKWKCIRTNNDGDLYSTIGDIFETKDDGTGGFWKNGSKMHWKIFDYECVGVYFEEITQFNKSNLQECDIVVLRNGERYVLFNNRLASDIRANISINQYSEILKINEFSTSYLDIMQVFRNNELIFERIEKSPQQIKIEEIEKTVAELNQQLKELKKEV